MSSQNIINIGEKVKHLRTKANLSIRQLAEISDVSPGHISQIENGKTNPSVTTLYAVAKALKVSIQVFFDVNESSEPALSDSEDEMETSQDLLDKGFQHTSKFGPFAMSKVNLENRATIKLDSGVQWARLTSRAFENIEFLELTYEPGSESGETFSQHIGQEFGLVLEGCLQFYHGFDEYELNVGDSILFDSGTPHKLCNQGDTIMRALWVAFNLGT